jgi:hypothetical protein
VQSPTEWLRASGGKNDKLPSRAIDTVIFFLALGMGDLELRSRWFSLTNVLFRPRSIRTYSQKITGEHPLRCGR